MLGVPLEMVHGGLRVGAVYISGVLAGGYDYHGVHIGYFDVVVLDVDDDVDVVDNIHRFPVDEHSEARCVSLRCKWRGLCSYNRCLITGGLFQVCLPDYMMVMMMRGCLVSNTMVLTTVAEPNEFNVRLQIGKYFIFACDLFFSIPWVKDRTDRPKKKSFLDLKDVCPLFKCCI